MNEQLHRFRLPLPDDWRPATPEDARALGNDLFLHGHAFATVHGQRVDPETVELRDGVAYGGKVTTGERPGVQAVAIAGFVVAVAFLAYVATRDVYAAASAAILVAGFGAGLALLFLALLLALGGKR